MAMEATQFTLNGELVFEGTLEASSPSWCIEGAPGRIHSVPAQTLWIRNSAGVLISKTLPASRVDVKLQVGQAVRLLNHQHGHIITTQVVAAD